MNMWFLTLFVQVLFLARGSSQEPSESLKVTLFFESMCPGCRKFITEQLYPGYTKIGSYLQVELVPYGNVKRKFENGTWIFHCQHGPEECAINKFEACGLAKSSDPVKQMEFIDCVETHVQFENTKPFVHCASKLGLPASEISKCSEGSEGNELLAIYGDKQNAAEPLLDHVPWVDFNSKHDNDLEEKAITDFLKLACDLLGDRPSNCSKFNEVNRF